MIYPVKETIRERISRKIDSILYNCLFRFYVSGKPREMIFRKRISKRKVSNKLITLATFDQNGFVEGRIYETEPSWFERKFSYQLYKKTFIPDLLPYKYLGKSNGFFWGGQTKRVERPAKVSRRSGRELEVEIYNAYQDIYAKRGESFGSSPKTEEQE